MKLASEILKPHMKKTSSTGPPAKAGAGCHKLSVKPWIESFSIVNEMNKVTQNARHEHDIASAIMLWWRYSFHLLVVQSTILQIDFETSKYRTKCGFGIRMRETFFHQWKGKKWHVKSKYYHATYLFAKWTTGYTSSVILLDVHGKTWQFCNDSVNQSKEQLSTPCHERIYEANRCSMKETASAATHNSLSQPQKRAVALRIQHQIRSQASKSQAQIAQLNKQNSGGKLAKRMEVIHFVIDLPSIKCNLHFHIKQNRHPSYDTPTAGSLLSESAF